jgi:hypothetical protein
MKKPHGGNKLVEDALQLLEVEAAGFAAAASGDETPAMEKGSELMVNWQYGATLFARTPNKPMHAGGFS